MNEAGFPKVASPLHLDPLFPEPEFIPQAPSRFGTFLNFYLFLIVFLLMLAAVGVTLGTAHRVSKEPQTFGSIFGIALVCSLAGAIAYSQMLESFILSRIRAVAYGAIITRTALRRWCSISLLLGLVVFLVAGIAVSRQIVAAFVGTPGLVTSTVWTGVSLAAAMASLQQGTIALRELRTSRLLGSLGELKLLSAGKVLARLAHLTDLHLTASEQSQRIEAGVNPIKPLQQVLARFAKTLSGVDAIVISGDITDTGTADEWRRFFELMPAALLHKTVLVPGNHDLNIHNADPRAAIKSAGSENPPRQLRKIRFLAAVDRIDDGRTRILGEEGFMPLATFLTEHRADLRKYTQQLPTRRVYRGQDAELQEALRLMRDPEAQKAFQERERLQGLPDQVWRQVFPMVVDVRDSVLKIVVVDSNDDSSNIVTNAFGRLNAWAAARLRKALDLLESEKSPYVITTHHHLAQPKREHREPFWPWLQARCLTMINAAEMIALLRGSRHQVVLHGHNHVEYEGTLGESLHVISGRSTTLGNAWDPRPVSMGFKVVGLSWSDDGVRVATLQDQILPFNDPGDARPSASPQKGAC